MERMRICLVTPALASANNGNWHTASRWARFLSGDYPVSVVPHWSGQPADLMIALHARRSAPSIAAWAALRPRRPLAVVLTGTDLYRDIDIDAQAQASLALADRLVVLNELGASRLAAPLRQIKTPAIRWLRAGYTQTTMLSRRSFEGGLYPRETPRIWANAGASRRSPNPAS